MIILRDDFLGENGGDFCLNNYLGLVISQKLYHPVLTSNAIACVVGSSSSPEMSFFKQFF
jgi:hypothetical protein